MEVIKFDLDKLQEQPDGFAYYILGRSYDLEENGAEQDYDVALEYYKKGNNLGYPLCTYSLGISYELGLGDALPIDEEKGNELLEQAYPEIIKLIDYIFRMKMKKNKNKDKFFVLNLSLFFVIKIKRYI